MDEQTRLPNTLKISCLIGGTPVPGAWVTVTLHMNEKTDFVSFHGPADDDGTVLVRGDDILAWAERNRKFAAADYADPERDWSGRLTVAPLVPDAARAAIKFYKMFQDKLDYPEGFSKELRGAISTLEPFKGETMELSLADADPAVAADSESVKLRRRPL